jgi:hypothetical protein
MPYIADEWEPDQKAYELFLCHIHALELEQYYRECEQDFLCDEQWESYDYEPDEEDISDDNVTLTDLF